MCLRVHRCVMKKILENARISIAEISRQIAALDQERERLYEVLSMYERIEEIAAQPAEIPIEPSESMSDHPQNVSKLPHSDEADSAEYGQKAEALRQIFFSARNGLSANNLWKIVTERGISDRRQFVYSNLNRWSQRGLLMRRNGRYYATEKLLAMRDEITEEGGPQTLQ
jgi:hypothetical protein